MITKGKPRRLARRLWVAAALLAAFTAASCGKKEEQKYEFALDRPPDYDRPLNQTELDSMRAMKITHRIVRDEYWDDKGGVLANERLEVWYPGRKIYVLQGIAVLKQMDQVADQIQKAFGKLPAEKLVVLCAPNLKMFTATGRDWWHYGLIKGDTLSMQNPMTLFTRQLLQFATQREYSRWAVGRLTHGKAPQWMVWGMAAYFSHEDDVYRGQRKEYAKLPLRMEVDDIEKALRSESDRIETRRAIYNAYLMVAQLVETNGMAAVAAFALALGEEPDAGAAAQRVFKKSYNEVLAQAQA